MKKSDTTEIKEIKALASQLVDKTALTKADIEKLNQKLDIVLAQFGIFRRYFKRLS